MIGVGKTGTQSAAVDHRGAEARAVPQIGSAGRPGQDLSMIRVDIMGGNIVEFVLTEQKLVRYDVGGNLFRPGNVSPGAEIAVGVGRFEFEADILAAVVV